MIRLNNGNPFLSPSLLIFALSLCVLSQGHGREDIRSAAEQKDYINKLKKELLQIKKDWVTLETNNEKPAGTPKLSPTIPKIGSKTLSPSPLILKRRTAISATKEDLRRIRKGLLELQGGKTTEAAKQEPSLETSVPVRRVVKVRQHGNYFLFIDHGIAFAQDRKLYAPGGPYLLSTHTGTEFSVAFGRQLGQWTIGSEIGFRRLGYKKFISPLGHEDATGDSISYSFALYGGYDLTFRHSWNIHTAISLGVSKIDEKITLAHIPALPITASGSNFQGSIRTALEYAFTDLCSAHLGYRFSYVDDLGDFGSMPIHQAELGLRLNL
jgi:hypothetical protein